MAEARTPKGRKACRAIFQSTRRVVTNAGLENASLEAIADGAGLSQAALRHHFPTREQLFNAFFTASSRWFRHQVAVLLKGSDRTALDKLECCISWHLEYMEHVDTAFWLEGSAYFIRHPQPRQIRDEFYSWLVTQYARLIGDVQPGLNRAECNRRGYVLLTLVVGAWITHGKGSMVPHGGGVLEQRRLLLDQARAIVTR